MPRRFAKHLLITAALAASGPVWPAWAGAPAPPPPQVRPPV